MDKRAKEATKGKISRKDRDVPDQQATEDASTTNTPVSSTVQTPLKSFSPFDFVPGDQLIAFEDFSQDAIGDFPTRWNTNGKGQSEPASPNDTPQGKANNRRAEFVKL